MIGIVIDIGTANTKIGFTGQSNPIIQTDSVHLEPENERLHHQDDQQLFPHHKNQKLYGSNVSMWRNDINAHSIFDQKWQDQTHKLGQINYTINRQYYLRFVADLIKEIKDKQTHHQYGILIIQPHGMTKDELFKFRQHLCEFVFENIGFSSIYFLKSSVATLFSEGRSSGIVIDSGENFTSVNRIIDGYQQKSFCLPLGGNLITYEIQKYLNKKGLMQNTKRSHNEVFDFIIRNKEVRLLKQQFAINNSSQIQQSQTIQLTLPDKNVIKIDRSDIKQPFTNYQKYAEDTHLTFPLKYKGISSYIFDLLEQGEKNNYDRLDTIHITGGNMLFSNIANQLSEQIVRTAEKRGHQPKKCAKSKNSLTSSWIGGSIVGNIAAFTPYWGSVKQYKEHGVSIINKICPY